MLHIGASVIESIDSIAKTDCGYAVIHDVTTHKLANRMESFFLAETTKYLYLLFDDDNFIHNSGSKGTVVDTPGGQCVIDAGGYIFNTEAHPIDIAALDCCHNPPREQFHDVINDLDQLSIVDVTQTAGERFLSSSHKTDNQEYINIRGGAAEALTYAAKAQINVKKNNLLTCQVEPFYLKFAIYGETVLEKNT